MTPAAAAIEPWAFAPGDNPVDDLADIRYRILRGVYLLEGVVDYLDKGSAGGDETLHALAYTARELFERAIGDMETYEERLNLMPKPEKNQAATSKRARKKRAVSK